MQLPMYASNIVNIDSKPKISKFDMFILYLFIIDILFFPYIRMLSATFSMIVLPLWYIFNSKKIKITFEFQLFIILIFFMMFSVLLSLVFFPQETWKPNITYLVIILYAFLYYFFFRYYFDKYSISLKKILIMYVAFGFVLGLIYLINPSLFFQVRSFWTMSGNVIQVEGSLLIHRFTSTFSDPNNASIAFVAVFTFLLFNEKLNFIAKLFVLFAITLIIFATMSSTGFILLGLTYIMFILHLFKHRKFKNKIKISTLISLIIIILLIPILYMLVIKFLGSDVAQLALYRFSSNSVDSRIEIWNELLHSKNMFNYILFGMGGTIIIDGAAFAPHNGHLFLIYNYGMIVYSIFIYIFFRIRKRIQLQYYLFLIPFFLGFTVNVGIYEPRFIFLLALLVAAYASSTSAKNEV